MKWKWTEHDEEEVCIRCGKPVRSVYTVSGSRILPHDCILEEVRQESENIVIGPMIVEVTMEGK